MTDDLTAEIERLVAAAKCDCDIPSPVCPHATSQTRLRNHALPLTESWLEMRRALEALLEGIAQNVMISARMGGKRDAAERIAKACAALKAEALREAMQHG